MSTFWKLKKESSFWAAQELKRIIPELKNYNTEILESHLQGTDLEFYKLWTKKCPIWLRFTMPFALIIWLLLLVFLLFTFLITGTWGYKIEWVKN